MHSPDPAAAAAGRRRRVLLVLAAFAALTAGVWQLAFGAGSARSLPPEIWGLEVDGASPPVDVAWLRASQLNALVLGPGLSARAEADLRRAAKRAGVLVLAAVPRARTIQSAVALAGGGTSELVAVRLRNLGELRELGARASRGRIVALLGLGAAPRFEATAWRRAIDVARLSPAVDLVVVPVGPAGRRALVSYLALLGRSRSPDHTPPEAPKSLAVRKATTDSITLAWRRSRDNRGPVAYAVSQDGKSVGTSLVPSFTFTRLACAKSFTLGVVAYDAAGNRSAMSTLRASTTPCPSYVSAAGSDSSRCTRTAPCASFDRAYHVASPGGVVEVAAGSYPEQTLTADASKTSTEDVVIQPAAGAAVSVDGELSFSGASHVTVRNMKARGVEFYAPTTDATAEGIDDDGHFGVWGASNVTLRGGQVYESVPTGHDPTIGFDLATGTIVPRNVLIDRVYFHDWQLASPDDHVECIQIWLADGLTIRNSRFRRCAHHALFINQYAPALGSSSLMRNVTIENNFFDAPNVGFYAIQIRPSNTPGIPCDNFLIRNNSFLQAVNIDCAGTGDRVENNILPSVGFRNCSIPGWTYGYNLLATRPVDCGPTNLTGVPAYVDAGNFDLHLKAGSRGINRANPKDYARRDIDGQLRPMGRRADIGADEFATR